MRGSVGAGVVQAVVAVVVGVVALPGIVGASAAGGQIGDVVWLIGGVVVSGWLIGVTPLLGAGLAMGLEGLVGPRVSGGTVGVVARWVVGVGDVVVVHAVLERPVVRVGGTVAEVGTVETAFGVGTVVVLLGLLIWLHRQARPVVEAATWQALDALIATTGSERVAAAMVAADARTVGALTRSGGATVAAGSVAATLRAGDEGAGVTRLGEETVATVRAGEAATVGEGAVAGLGAQRGEDEAPTVREDATRGDGAGR